MNRLAFSPRRVWVVAHNTVLEAMRQKLLAFLLLLAMALVVGARWLRAFNFGAPELRFLADCGLGAIAILGPALTIAATVQLFFGELENRTVQTLLAKPVWRAEFVLGKFAGVVFVAALFCASVTALLAAVLWYRQRELIALAPEGFPSGGTIDYAGVAMAGALHWLEFAVLAALVLLVASYARAQLFAAVTGFFLLVICHLQPLAHEAGERAGSWGGRAAAALLGSTLPDFQIFGLADGFVGSPSPGWSEFGRVVAYACCYIAAGCALAIFSFRRREI
jgi:ABC-type transport system involved in multi-copper enzyme maturation permease subunit